MIKNFVNNLFKLDINGLENFDFTRPTILIPNHTSLLDAPLLALNLPRDIVFVVNTEIAEKYKRFIGSRETLTVDPLNPYSVRSMVKVVRSGKPLLIFPEGRITTTGGLMKVYDGIAYLALKTGANVYPISLRGLERSRASYLKHKLPQRWFPRTSITVDEPFVVTPQEGIPFRLQKRLVANQILERMQTSLFDASVRRSVNLYNKLLTAAEENGANSVIVQSPGFIQKTLPDGHVTEVAVTESLTYKKLIIATTIFANKLETLLGDEKNVGLLLPNSNGHVIALFALFKINKTPAILNFSLGSQTLIDCCETADLKTIITSRRFIAVGKLGDLISTLIKKGFRILYLEDIKKTVTLKDKIFAYLEFKWKSYTNAYSGDLILFTSGSESKPKGVVLSHDNVYANVLQAKSIIDFTPHDKVLNVLPMFHSFGLTAGTLLPILTGMPTYLFPSPLRFKDIPEVSYASNATILFGTSTFLKAYGVAAHPYDFYSLRYVFAGAEALKDEVRTLWSEKFGIRIFEGYGATEAAPIVSLNTPLFCKRGTVGKFVPALEHKIVPLEGIPEGGQLFIKGPNLMQGYLIHGKGFIEHYRGDWYDTGDIVSVDSEGFITIRDRLKRFAKIAGEMVPLNLVEQVAEECFRSATAVVSIPDDRKGERLILFVTSRDLELRRLRQHLQSKSYSPLFLPSEIRFIDRFPELGSGKRDYVTLKTLAIEGDRS